MQLAAGVQETRSSGSKQRRDCEIRACARIDAVAFQRVVPCGELDGV
jgi:hypothetical protein